MNQVLPVVMQFEDKCPTNFSLSPKLDKLKLVGHQTALLLTVSGMWKDGHAGK
jgi:hypothetical protein